ncbi:MAG: DUF2125 domain-containing protein [Pseudomonadota bacterium]
MARFFSMAALAAGGLWAGQAAADLTAAEAWQAFQDANGPTGTMTWDAVEDGSGSILVTGVVLEMGDGLSNVEIAFGTLSFEEENGAVRLILEDSIPIEIASEFEGQGSTISGRVEVEAADIRFSGSPEDLTQTYSVGAMRMILDDINEAPDLATFDVTMALAAMAGETRLTGTDAKSAAYSLTADSLTYAVKAGDPTEGNFDMDAVLSGISLAGTASVPLGFAAFGSSALLSDPDYAVDATFASQSMTASATFADVNGDGAFEVVAGQGDVAIQLADGQASYDGGLNGLDVSVAAPGLPLPVNVSLARYGYQVEMPLVSTEASRDMVLGLDLLGITLDDFLWNLFDPGAVLPRDPADLTFLVDLDGRWLIDIMDPEAASTMGADVPIEVTAATISDLRLSAAGAELTGDGSFTFDNEDLFTFDGLPAPDGAIDLRLVGANGLIDALIQMGLLPADQAMGARMMLGLFMTPGEGPDTLTSRIEVRPDGQVLANGQRIR